MKEGARKSDGLKAACTVGSFNRQGSGRAGGFSANVAYGSLEIVRLMNRYQPADVSCGT